MAQRLLPPPPPRLPPPRPPCRPPSPARRPPRCLKARTWSRSFGRPRRTSCRQRRRTRRNTLENKMSRRQGCHHTSRDCHCPVSRKSKLGRKTSIHPRFDRPRAEPSPSDIPCTIRSLTRGGSPCKRTKCLLVKRRPQLRSRTPQGRQRTCDSGHVRWPRTEMLSTSCRALERDPLRRATRRQHTSHTRWPPHAHFHRIRKRSPPPRRCSLRSCWTRQDIVMIVMKREVT